MSEITIKRVENRSDLKRFIRVHYQLNDHDPAYIRPLMKERLDSLSPQSNPFFEHSETDFFIAVRAGVDVGTISVQLNDLAQEKWGPNLGHFGLFEAADQDVATALFAKAEQWHKDRGIERLQGPWNLSPNEQAGMLADGFDTPPVIMMPHGNKDYLQWTEAAGFSVVKKLIAFATDPRTTFDPVTARVAQMSHKSAKSSIRQMDMKNFRADLEIILDIFNDAWSENWGYIKMTDAEMDHMAKELKPIVHQDLVFICEYEGRPVAFMLTIPDVNDLIKDLNGSLLPFGLFKLAYRLFINKTFKRFRVPLMGMRKDLHNQRIGMAMLFDMILKSREAVVKRGGEFVEMGWILDNNSGMINMIEAVGGTGYKTYHIYEKLID